MRVMRWWPVTTVVVLVVAAGGALAMWLLGVWAPIPQRVSDPDRLRLDRIKTGLTVAAGLAAGVTLLMTLRRQALSERAQRFAESDALEQRTTALYVAAADQLGSDKAAVRLAGLYALERLGQDNPKLRQTVFDVWCAYLRMPYTPPVEVLRRNAKHSPERPAPDAGPQDQAIEAERRQELEVRLTAQRLLGAHLSVGLADAGLSTYWWTNERNRLIVDLVGATLVDFNLRVCAVGRANFSGAQFYGHTDLAEAQFHGDADLVDAQFHGDAGLVEAQFHRVANLCRAQFHGVAGLHKAQFYGDARLDEAQFHGDARLDEAQFHGDAHVGDAQFNGLANLYAAQFYGDANLSGVHFHGHVLLGRAQFHGRADLYAAQFYGDARLGETQFYSVANFIGAEFHCHVNLGEAQFIGGLAMSGTSETFAALWPERSQQSAAVTDDQPRPVVDAGDTPEGLHGQERAQAAGEGLSG